MSITPEIANWLGLPAGPPPVPTMRELAPMIHHLRGNFMSQPQLQCMVGACHGEEGDYFKLKLKEVYDLVTTMPKTYDQDGLGENAVIHLHYFAGGRANWWITERDKGDGARDQDQHQAFGLADLFGDGGELGYISLVELTGPGVNAELDLHWTPKTIKQLREERDRDNAAEREIYEIEGGQE